jgi:hypothetical protein
MKYTKQILNDRACNAAVQVKLPSREVSRSSTGDRQKRAMTHAFGDRLSADTEEPTDVGGLEDVAGNSPPLQRGEYCSSRLSSQLAAALAASDEAPPEG